MSKTLTIPRSVRKGMLWGTACFFVVELITLIIYPSDIYQNPLIYVAKLSFWLCLGSLTGFIVHKTRKKANNKQL